MTEVVEAVRRSLAFSTALWKTRRSKSAFQIGRPFSLQNTLKVDVAPVKPQELAEAHPGPQRTEQQRNVAGIGVPRRPEEPRLLLGGERIDAMRRVAPVSEEASDPCQEFAGNKARRSAKCP